LCDEETIRRLRVEKETYMDEIEQNGAPVGSAVVVTYAEGFRLEHQIGRFGRATMKEGEVIYHAAPQHIDRTEKYDYVSSDVLDYVYNWQDGEVARVPTERLLAVNFPEPKKEKIRKASYHEMKLFRKVLLTHKITLVNPSFSCMTGMIQCTNHKDPGLVYLTSEQGGEIVTSKDEESWVWKIRHFVRESAGRLKIVTKKDIQGICYLGASDPRWYPETLPWFRLIVSPFHEPTSDYKGIISSFDDKGFVTAYTKKGRTVSATLLKDEPTYVYNPETLDKDLGFEKKDSKQFFLESSIPFQFKECQDGIIFHKPYFLSAMGEWVGDKNVRDGLIYDVKGSGTYLSRRARYAVLPGEEWAPFVPFGPYLVTYSSITPQIDPEIIVVEHEGVQVMSVDGSIPIWPDYVTFRKQVLELDESTLPSAIISSKEDVLDHTYARIGDRYFPLASYHETSPSWSLNGGSYLPSPYGRQNMQHLPGYSWGMRDMESYIDCTALKTGFHCVASTIQALGSSIPNLNRYFQKMWAGRVAWSNLPVSVEDGSMVVTNVVQNQIIEYIDRKNRFRLIPVSTIELAQTIGITLTLAAYYCTRSSDIMLWEPGANGRSEWILRKDLNRQKMPRPVQIGSGEFRPQTYLSVIKSLMARETVTILGMFGKLYYLLLHNNFPVFTQVKDGYTTMQLYKNKFS